MVWPLHINTIPVTRLFKRQRHTYPLLDESVINTLRQFAQRSVKTALDVHMAVHQRLLGEKLSPYVRQGYEFAEVRPYQPGDSARFINWQRYASTRQLYINRFVEERRPQCWLVMDRRTTMQFGTRVRLKITQAAMFAVYHLYKAHYQQIAVGGVVIENRCQWFDARSSSRDLQILQQHIIAPCTPVSPLVTEPALERVLRNLRVRCQPGCLIFLISDFHDLDDTTTASLSALTAAHAVCALHIVDRVEECMPGHGVFNLTDNHTDQTYRIDCNNTSLRKSADLTLQQALLAKQKRLKQHGVQYRCIHADENLLDTDTLLYAR